MNSLAVKAFAGTFVVLICMGLLIFLPAWTFDYWQGWVFLAVFGVLSLGIVVYLLAKDQKLLERRLSGGPTAEQTAGEKIVMTYLSLAFIALLVVPALDHRFGWSSVPGWLSIVANLLIVLGWIIILFVFRENTFTSATIQVVTDQTVTSTGLYAVVRHPMYSGSFLYILAMPIALGSWWGLIVVLLALPGFLWRIFDEESLLKKNLAGYAEYTQKVRYRLVPLVW